MTSPASAAVPDRPLARRNSRRPGSADNATRCHEQQPRGNLGPCARDRPTSSKIRLRKALVDERSAWQRRIHAQLFHHGAPRHPSLLAKDQRGRLANLELPAAARLQIETAFALIDAIGQRLAPIERDLRSFARRQAGCRALMRHLGIGELTSVAILAELGDERRAPGKLSQQGSPVLRWALFEAAQSACRPASPDHDYYAKASARLNPKRAVLSVARKLARRAHHTLRELGDEGLAPVH